MELIKFDKLSTNLGCEVIKHFEFELQFIKFD